MSKRSLKRALVYCAFGAVSVFGQTISSNIVGTLADPGNALTYVRSAVLNRCRNARRQRGQRDRHDRQGPGPMASESAEAVALIGEEHQQVLAGIRALPDRQREALVLRFYLDLSEEETARAMGVSRGAVKSATSRAVAALGRKLKEGS